MNSGDDLLNLPEPLRNVTGIGKERIVELKARRMLGLALSIDEPIRDIGTGKVIPVIEVIDMVHKFARRYMLRNSKEVPLEDRPEWRA